MALVAVVQNGVWVPVDDGRPPVNQKDDTHLINIYTSDVDQIVAHLAQVVRLAQGLSTTDARRVRELVHATSSTLWATTALSSDDQKLFERSLREAANKRG